MPVNTPPAVVPPTMGQNGINSFDKPQGNKFLQEEEARNRDDYPGALRRAVDAVGPFATILPVGVVFALLHGGNPHATWFAIANTAGFGILFGYAYWRSRDLWLPIGLHFGWNLVLPLFGVNLSGLTMKVTGYAMAWSAGRLWSGGDYGPEASVLTSAALVALSVYLWKAPVRRQTSPFDAPPVEEILCEPSRPSAS